MRHPHRLRWVPEIPSVVTGKAGMQSSYSVQRTRRSSATIADDRDFSDLLYSFWKNELAELHKDWGKSPMPSYRSVFNAAELDDLVAYLAGLRGDQ